MSQTVIVSDHLYKRLETEAQRRGLDSIEALLESWTSGEHTHNQRSETVRAVRAFRERMHTKYGEAPDSVEFLRTDRMR